MKGEDILKIYREKDIIEKAFRTIKYEIEMRPFFLSSETSVIGYVFICALAYQIRSVLKFTAQGNRVVVEGRNRGTARTTGRTYEHDWVMIFTMHDSKVIRFRHYYDTADVLEAFNNK